MRILCFAIALVTQAATLQNMPAEDSTELVLEQDQLPKQQPILGLQLLQVKLQRNFTGSHSPNSAGDLLQETHGQRHAGISRNPKGVHFSFQIIIGIVLLILGSAIEWFNEERSARIDALLGRGLDECRSVDSEAIEENIGRLVHVQGRARAQYPLVDPQFQDAVITDALKLQSTVEVYEWVPTLLGPQKETHGVPRFHTEWTTTHHDSSRFRQPSPKNPRLPRGLNLGTFTTSGDDIRLGSFHLSQDLLSQFHGFTPAHAYLPATVTAGDITFHANMKDGFFYARPSSQRGAADAAKDDLFNLHQEGDLRVRFMFVPSCETTVVAVQSLKDERNTFVPYRMVPLGPCARNGPAQLVEEGQKPLRNLRAGGSCVTGGVATCCCCPCNTVACFTNQEVITEEIFYVAPGKQPHDAPFRQAVGRSSLRVWFLRLLGWATTYFAIGIMGHHVWEDKTFLKSFGDYASAVFNFILVLSMWAVISAAACMCYRPSMSIKYGIAAVLISGLPLIWDRFHQSL
eukprot:TRINITY_DN20870_c0_g1_i1.p1 TRINITY_DN20870_c0_g1~~TRINITY_DN20870_c0_g1_i1.p1  ORF type:complete len:516 (-),score=53.87 TRINITY_DN20870_c0_g1_i1:6-1553(-)